MCAKTWYSWCYDPDKCNCSHPCNCPCPSERFGGIPTAFKLKSFNLSLIQLCGSDLFAIGSFLDVITGKMTNLSNQVDTCDWWRTRCGITSSGTTFGYSMAMRLMGSQEGCKMALQFYQACDFDLVQCCQVQDYDRPPYRQQYINWELVASYEAPVWVDPGGFCENMENTFKKVYQQTGCGNCSETGINMSFPEEIVVVDTTWEHDVPGGIDCNQQGSCCYTDDNRPAKLYCTVTTPSLPGCVWNNNVFELPWVDAGVETVLAPQGGWVLRTSGPVHRNSWLPPATTITYLSVNCHRVDTLFDRCFGARYMRVNYDLDLCALGGPGGMALGTCAISYTCNPYSFVTRVPINPAFPPGYDGPIPAGLGGRFYTQSECLECPGLTEMILTFTE